ncbi:thiazole-adenylate synthase [Candidatus Nitrososphaera evergladensis SR1]|jgi:thiazole biosynthesis enzyme|uniref:Thiamine thiazole synthase n=1 Tax=Candidatus Nitrososphaera evergladensis SR1 TaxID=1459636 RepID=A0A075MS19_9ARCH|nr:sulfide-dependent adenosine diphosphate thiazole synthase [Candidatus Nitrososphaera evergladensis]AIF84311.1 thiazole-adenylate synthase [Candidatus Nitrososphaera evergladensis SR1]
MAKIFSDASEKEITRTIAQMFNETMNEFVDSDVIIIGAGPAGLTAGRDLAKAGVRTLIVEQNNYIGGGYWVGGYMMNPVTVRAPAQKLWDEIGVPYRKISDGLYATWGPHACSKLIASACDAGVRFLQLTKFDDLVLKNKRVAGVVVNWMPVSALPRNITCVDPVALESKLVIDASGHDSVAVKRLMDRGYVKWKGMDPMWVEGSEDNVVNFTGEVFPGLIAAGMSVTETHGLPRMGPTFGAMLFSGKKAAEVALGKLKEMPNPPKISSGGRK